MLSFFSLVVGGGGHEKAQKNNNKTKIGGNGRSEKSPSVVARFSDDVFLVQNIQPRTRCTRWWRRGQGSFFLFLFFLFFYFLFLFFFWKRKFLKMFWWYFFLWMLTGEAMRGIDRNLPPPQCLIVINIKYKIRNTNSVQVRCVLFFFFLNRMCLPSERSTSLLKFFFFFFFFLGKVIPAHTHTHIHTTYTT